MMLIALLGVIAYFIYQAWQLEHHQAPVASTQVQTASASTESGATTSTQTVHVVTDTQTVDIDLKGGDLHRLLLNHYSVSKDKPDDKLALLDDQDGRWSVLQTGLVGAEQVYSGPDSVYTAPASSYTLATGADTLEVPLEYHDASGVEVRKLYRFHRGSYVVDLQQTLVNDSSAALKVTAYAKFVRVPGETNSGPPLMMHHGFSGFGFYEQKSGSSDYRFKKLAFKDVHEEPLDLHQQGGWLVMLEHYFLAAILPPNNEQLSFSAKPSNSVTDALIGQYLGSTVDVAAGQTQAFPLRLYFGPETQGNLDQIAPGLAYTEDYGILTPIAKPLFWILKAYHGLSGNWGVAIILLTLTIKAVFFKLSEAQYRSAAKMRKFGPRLKELKERYADDREKLNKAMMELYKKEGFNPLAGCWPVLIQMPVFFALYWVLGQSVELRQAPFALWIHDLTASDPYFVLPTHR